MVHPQKRLFVKRVLEDSMLRVVELKHRLVEWNPPNPNCQPHCFPWEYVNFDEILQDLKMDPDMLVNNTHTDLYIH